MKELLTVVLSPGKYTLFEADFPWENNAVNSLSTAAIYSCPLHHPTNPKGIVCNHGLGSQIWLAPQGIYIGGTGFPRGSQGISTIRGGNPLPHPCGYKPFPEEVY